VLAAASVGDKNNNAHEQRASGGRLDVAVAL
jgi:hypothetical protein